jgi:hypothetical protein
MVLPPQRRARPPPYTDKVLMEKGDSWHHGVSPASHQAWLDSLLTALKNPADTGLGQLRSSRTSTISGSSPSWRGSSAFRR